MRSMLLLSVLSISGLSFAQPAPVYDANGQPGIEQRVSKIERMLNAKNAGMNRMQSQLEQIQLEVDELRGSLETHNYKLEQILQRQRELYGEIDRLLAGQSGTSELTSDSRSGTPTSVRDNTIDPAQSVDSVIASEVENPAEPTVDDITAYQAAVELVIKQKRYDDAVPAFEAFISQYPESKYIANGHYWLGQLKFNRMDYKAAERHFSLVVNQYSDSNKRAVSMLKLGESLEKLGNIAKAVEVLEQLQTNYPQSSAKKMADARLRNLKQNN